MKKSLHTAPVTAHFQEPTENPFQFRECNPLRKEIHNYFALEVKPTSYRPKLEPFYAPEPFPVLEPIKSPELPHSPEPGPTPGSSRAAEAESETLNKSTASSSHTVKDMEISRISEEPGNASEREVPREQHTHGFVKKPKDKKHKTTKDRHHVHRSSRASQDEASSNVSVYGKVSSTTSVREKSASPDVEIISNRSQRSPYSRQSSGRHTPQSAPSSSKRAFQGRLKSHGSDHSSSNQQAPVPVPLTIDTTREGTKPVYEINPINPDNATFIKFSQKVNVTHVINPHKFYVQNQAFKQLVNQLCREDGEDAEIPEEVKIGALYLAQPTSERRWYRSRVLGWSKKSKKYEVLFVDYGRTDEIAHEGLRVLGSDLHGFDDGAYECSLYDIVPAGGGKKWAPEVKQIMIDFIENKQLIMYVIQAEKGASDQVDLIMQTIDSPKSLRESLIYLGLAKADPKPPKRNDDATQRISHLQKVKKRWILDYKRRILARELEKDDVFKTKITFSVSPSEFYIRRSSLQEAYCKMQTELTEYCTKEARVAYSPHVGMVCAFAEKDRDDLLVWKRGRVVKVGEGNCELYSVDTGHRLTICWQDIRELSKPLCAPFEFAVRCKLMHIQPFKQHKYRWTDEAVQSFNRIAVSSSVFQVIIGEQQDDCYDVALYILKHHSDTCVNALMVKNGFAVSTGSESSVVERPKEVEEVPFNVTPGNVSVGAASNSKSSTSEKRQARVRVDILRVVTPNEFYVSLVKNTSGIARMQEEIQNKMDEKMDDGDDKTSWQQGEICLVFPTPSKGRGNEAIGCEWYRARVLEVVDDSNYTVFLIDKAYTMNSHYSNMSTIPTELKEVHPAAIRCFLACIGPTGQQNVWSSSVVDAFKVAIEKFKCYSISLHGRSVNDSLPVILWGMTMESTKALSPQMYTYTNINNKLVLYGYAHLKEKFQPLSSALSVEEELARHYKAFDKFIEDLDVEMRDPVEEASYSGSSDAYHYDITDEVTPIDHWLPAKPVDKTIFVGVPTYVDNNAVIYLHDMDKERTLDTIKNVINAKFGNSQPLPSDTFYAPGDPCMAKYHLDDLFYRAIVRKMISPCRYKVQFVDYGNIEECDVKDLRKNVICGKVPTLANKYRLTDVASKQHEGIWSIEALDTLHALIVGKQCQVRVDTEMDTDPAGVVPCYLKTTGELVVEVSDYLVRQGLAVKERGVFEEKVDELYDPYMTLGGACSSEAAASPKSGRMRIGANFGLKGETDEASKDNEPNVDLHARVNQKELTDLLDYVTAEQNRSDAAEFEDAEVDDSGENGSGIDLNKVQYFYSYGDIKLEPGSDSEEGEISDDAKKSDEAAEGDGATDASSTISFNPNEFDTSTQIDPPLEMTRPTLHGYPEFSLDESVHGFYCEVTNLVSPFSLFVFPQLDDHIQRMKETMARIQCYAKKNRKCPDIEPKMPCLAVFKQDGFWYRALIEEYFPDRGEVRVFYVDYLNKETVSVRDILKCPVSLRRVPLRNVQIELHALQANPRMREPDVTRKLVELIEGKKLYARVVSRSPKLEVELFSDSRCKQLIYHQMIKEKYFLLEK
nr:RING finger protein 17-like isoform X2 [Aedes albopictus]